MARHFLFLCSQLSGYLHACIVRLADAVPDSRVTIVAQPGSQFAPFPFPSHPAIEILDRTKLGRADFLRFVEARPSFAYLSGWRDAEYRRAGRRLRGICPVAIASDNLWDGSAKQVVMTRLFSRVIRRCASHAWVPGMYQYEYMRRLGFPRERILTGMYTASNELYERTQPHAHAVSGTKTILFVGNVWEAKGVVELVSAFLGMERKWPDWRLRIIGDGPLRTSLSGRSPNISLPGFVAPTALPAEFRDAAVFCLPSYRDHWAVVIHEACCAGLPIVATNACGAVSALVHHGYNGFQCTARSVSSLQAALERIAELGDDGRAAFGQRSLELSRQFTQDLWVSKVLSVL